MAGIQPRTFENTRSVVLDLIRSSRAVSRVELVEKSGLTGTTITRVVKRLIDDGLVVESGQGDSTGGKRRTLLELNLASRYAIGLSIDDSQLTYVVTDMRGNIVGRKVSPGLSDWLRLDAIDRIADELESLLTELGIGRTSVIGVGVASAGRLDSAHRTLRLARSIDSLGSFSAKEALERRTGLAVTLENDSTCAALAEFWIGRIPATQDFATIYMATGIGCGLMVDGRIFRGASANAGTIAHTVIDVNGPKCWCGARGCLEVLASPEHVVRRAMQIPELITALRLDGDPAGARTDFALIAHAAEDGEPTAVALIEQSAAYLAVAVVSTINLLDLDRVILAGPGFAAAGAIYLRVLRDHVTRTAFMRSVISITIDLSGIGADTAAIGGAALVLQEQLTPHQFAPATS